MGLSRSFVGENPRDVRVEPTPFPPGRHAPQLQRNAVLLAMRARLQVSRRRSVPHQGDPDALGDRAGTCVDDLYHDICAGALIPTVAGDRDREVVVPLAHQSALAGILLATQLLVAEQPELAALRPSQAAGVIRRLPHRCTATLTAGARVWLHLR